MLAATAALGARQVRVTMPRTDSGDYRELFAAPAATSRVRPPRAAELGVKALVELHHETITASASAAFRLVDGLDPEHVGVIHDLGNLVIEGQEDAAGRLPAARTVPGARAREERALGRGRAGRRRHGALAARVGAAAHGQADVDGYFAALHAFGYDGWVTSEDFSTELPLEERTRDNLAYLRPVEAAHAQPRRA